jgi:hypothetical protein
MNLDGGTSIPSLQKGIPENPFKQQFFPTPKFTGGINSVRALCVTARGRVDEKVALDADRRRRFDVAPRKVGFFIFVRAFRVCSSHSSHDVFSPAMVKDRLVFDGVVFRDGACLFRS